MKTIGGKTPAATTPDPWEGIDDDAESMMSETEASSEIEASIRKDQKDLKAQCLIRDGDRCQITKAFDETSLSKKPEVAALAGELGSMEDATECCHILPFYLGSFNEENIAAVGNIYLL